MNSFIPSDPRVYCSETPFLIEHQGLWDFCRQTLERRKNQPAAPVSVVCDRKEDVLALRAQMHAIFCSLQGHDAAHFVMGGVQTATLDAFARGLAQWARLALSRAHQVDPELCFGSLTAQDLKRPFLDVVKQEHLTEQLLYLIGYSGGDALPIAKQLLTLCDTPLPPDLNLARMLLAHENEGTSQEFAPRLLSRAKGTSLHHLSFVLAAFQCLPQILHRFMRTQDLVQHGFDQASEDSLDILCKALPPRLPAIRMPLLWLRAPSYAVRPSGSRFSKECPYRPGNFASAISDGLFTSCLALRSRYQELQHEETEVFVLDTLLAHFPRDNEEETPQNQVREIGVHPHIGALAEHSAQDAQKAQAATSVSLLGDLSLENLRVIHPLAHGRYPVTKKYLEDWLTFSQPQGSQGPDSAIQMPEDAERSIRAKWELSAELDSLLEPSLEAIRSIAARYDLSHLEHPTSARFRLRARDTSFRMGPAHPLESLPQALSFIATSEKPKELWIYGKPHNPRPASLTVRVLNQLMHRLQLQGVAIDPPAHDIMYRCFWHRILLCCPCCRFELPHPDDIEDTLLYVPQGEELLQFRHPGRTTLSHIPEALSEFLDGSIHPAVDAAWQSTAERLRRVTNPKRGQKEASHQKNKGFRVSVTEFENYLECPLQFYLKHVLRLDTSQGDPFAADPLETGTRTHAALEKLTTLLRFLQLDAEENRHDLAARLQHSFHCLMQPHIFTSTTPSAWQHALHETLLTSSDSSKEAELDGALTEAISVLFHPERSTSSLQSELGIEAAKRFFVRYLFTEARRLADDVQRGQRRETSFVEHRVTIDLGVLTLEGRIDRIDWLSDSTTGESLGHELIDYKTSKISDKEERLVLFPEALLSSSQDKLSVQGGLYVLGWLQRQQLVKELQPAPVHFTLYRLGSMQWERESILQASLDLTQEECQRELSELKSSFKEAAQRLHCGEFPAQPRERKTCLVCSFAQICPVGRSQQNPFEAEETGD